VRVNGVAAGAEPRHVAIGVATCRRPEGLARLLDGLAGLTFVKQARPALTVIVADNDPDRSGAAVCAARRSPLGLPLVYAAEPRAGLSFVRNRVLDLVPAEAGALALIDDDEVPASDWLDELLDCWQRTGAAIVTGRVEPRFAGPVPEWVSAGRFFRSPVQRTGSPTRRGGTCNCLIDARVFRQLGVRFETAYAHTGGEDTHCFWRVAALGEAVLWCDEAIVHEWVPPERTTVGWLARREYREGGTVALVERDLGASAVARGGRILRGAGRIAQGVLWLVSSPPLSPRLAARAVEGVKLAARGLGMIAGTLGVRFLEYGPRAAVCGPSSRAAVESTP